MVTQTTVNASASLTDSMDLGPTEVEMLANEMSTPPTKQSLPPIEGMRKPKRGGLFQRSTRDASVFDKAKPLRGSALSFERNAKGTQRMGTNRMSSIKASQANDMIQELDFKAEPQDRSDSEVSAAEKLDTVAGDGIVLAASKEELPKFIEDEEVK